MFVTRVVVLRQSLTEPRLTNPLRLATWWAVRWSTSRRKRTWNELVKTSLGVCCEGSGTSAKTSASNQIRTRLSSDRVVLRAALLWSCSELCSILTFASLVLVGKLEADMTRLVLTGALQMLLGAGTKRVGCNVLDEARSATPAWLHSCQIN